MLPMPSYAGLLRPGLTALAIAAMVILVQRSRGKAWHGQWLRIVLVVYGLLLIYATFLSREAADTYSYRLRLLGAARNSFTLEGGWRQVLPRLFAGDFSRIRIDDPEALEGIVINVLMFIPLGFLLPRIWSKIRFRHVMWIGLALTAAIETVQLLTRLGMFDLDDMLNNVIGASLGYGLQRWLDRWR